MKWDFNFKLVILFIVISLGMVTMGVISFRQFHFYRETNSLIIHTQQIIHQSEKVISHVKEFSTGSRGYLITHDSAFLEHYMAAMDSLPQLIQRLKELTNDKSSHQIHLDSLVPLIYKRLEFSQNIIRLANNQQDELAYQLIESHKGFNYMEQVRSLIENIQKEENELLKQRNRASRENEEASDVSYVLLVVANLAALLFTLFVILSDYRYRKKAQEELHKRGELYAQTLVSLGDGVITTNEHGIINFLNKAAVELTGWEPEEAIGQDIVHVFQITNESSGLTVANPAIEAMKLNKVMLLANHTILKRKDGGQLDIDDSGAPIHDLGGNVIGGVLVFRDVTAKKKAEVALKANEEKFRAYFNNSMAGILITSPEGKIYNANPAACALLGRTEEEICLLGRNGILDVADPLVTRFLEQGKDMGKAIGEHMMARGDGSTFPVAVSSALFNHVNGEKRSCLIFEDITDRKKNEAIHKQMHQELEMRVAEKTKEVIEKEERYRNSLNHMMEGVQIIDYNWRYVYLNMEALKQSTYSIEQLVGNTMMEMYQGIEKTPLFATLKECMMQRKSINMDNEFLYADGTTRWFDLSIQPVPEGLFILSTDITDRKLAEQKLFQQNTLLQKTNTELDRFVYSVSHDLRAPLSSLLGLIDIVSRDIVPSDHHQQKRMEMMKKSVNKLDSFINDILDFSRNGRTTIAHDKIVFDELLYEVSENFVTMAAALECPVSFKSEQHHDFISDKRRINIILNNLISNGIKYRDTLKNNSFVTIHVQTFDSEAILEVEDNGIGIEESDQDKIFEMFERVSTQANGSGIGLYIVKETIEKLNGTISLQSTPARGSKFIVKIPNQKQFV